MKTADNITMNEAEEYLHNGGEFVLRGGVAEVFAIHRGARVVYALVAGEGASNIPIPPVPPTDQIWQLYNYMAQVSPLDSWVADIE